MKMSLAWIEAGFVLSMLLSGLAIGYVVFKGKRNALSINFVLMHLLLLVWSTGDFLRLFLTDYSIKWLVVRFEYAVICFVGLCWLLLCLNYVDSRFKTPKNIAWLCSLPLFCFLTVLTNDYHHLFLLEHDRNFNQFGPFFYIHAFGSYLYCAFGTGIILNYALKEMRHLRPQAVLMIGAAVTPLAVNILTIFKVINVNQFDFTPLSFNVSSLILLIAVFKYKLLDIRPVALRKIMDHLKEAIVVTDNFGRIVEYNQPFLEIFPELEMVKPGDHITILSDVLNLRCDGNGPPELTDIFNIRKTSQTGEIYLNRTRQCFIVNIQPLWHGKVFLGNVFSFNDVTEYRHLLEEVKEKNAELIVLNQQLQDQAAMAEEVAVLKERNRLAQDMHDTLGQTMTLVITMLQMCQKSCLSNPIATKAKLEEALQFAVKGLEQTRKILYGLAGVTQKSREIREILQTLLLTFESFGTELTLKVEGEEVPLEYEVSQTIYRLCQEALTNAIRHGRARQIGITIKFIAERVFLEIINDGAGTVNFKRGMGLSGMEQRIKSLNGNIVFLSSKNVGFLILAELPLKDKGKDCQSA